MDIDAIIQKISIWALPVLLAIILHEVAHGWVAEKFGDNTARWMGRITLNPIKHIDRSEERRVGKEIKVEKSSERQKEKSTS